MANGDLITLLSFCATVLIPLLFSALYTVNAYLEVPTADTYTEKRSAVLSILSGSLIGMGCIGFIIGAISTYFNYEFMAYISTLMATGFVLTAAILLSLNAVMNYQKTGDFTVNEVI